MTHLKSPKSQENQNPFKEVSRDRIQRHKQKYIINLALSAIAKAKLRSRFKILELKNTLLITILNR